MVDTLLNPAFLGERIDHLTELCAAQVAQQNDDIRAYVERRVTSVAEQLAELP